MGGVTLSGDLSRVMLIMGQCKFHVRHHADTGCLQLHPNDKQRRQAWIKWQSFPISALAPLLQNGCVSSSLSSPSVSCPSRWPHTLITNWLTYKPPASDTRASPTPGEKVYACRRCSYWVVSLTLILQSCVVAEHQQVKGGSIAIDMGVRYSLPIHAGSSYCSQSN